MFMRKFLFILVFSLSANALVFGNDSIDQLQKQIEVVQKNLRNSDKQIKIFEGQNASLKTKLLQQGNTIDSLKKYLTRSENELVIQKFKLQKQKEINDANYSTVSSQYYKVVALVIICLVLLLLVGIIIILRIEKQILFTKNRLKRLQSDSKKSDEFRISMDKRILELEEARLTFDKDLKTKLKDSDDKPNHSLVLKIANEITRVETNLSRMDSSIKGYRQLQASVRRIKDNLSANGYEIIDMLGKPFDDRMKVEANFIPDDTLKEGQQIITNVIKPQVNYKGVMIQAAQITVSQN